MADKVDDGGPAFPMPAEYDADGMLIHSGDPGMSLRDWFGGLAMQGIISKLPCKYTTLGASPDKVELLQLHVQASAKGAYHYADVMFAQRKQNPE